VLRIGDYLGKNTAFSVYKSLICRKSIKAIEKRGEGGCAAPWTPLPPPEGMA